MTIKQEVVDKKDYKKLERYLFDFLENSKETYEIPDYLLGQLQKDLILTVKEWLDEIFEYEIKFRRHLKESGG